MKNSLIVVLFGLAATFVQGGESQEKKGSLLDYVASGKLTPERCAPYSPVDQLGRLSEEGILWDNGSVAYQTHSEAVFFKEYAKQLKTLTARKNPKAADSRKELVALLTEVSNFLISLDSHRNYDSDRIPGYAEWLLYSADPQLFQPRQSGLVEIQAEEANFTINDVRTLIRGLGFIRVESGVVTLHPREFIQKGEDRIITKMNAFERHLNDSGKQYFRFMLISYMDDLRGKLYVVWKSQPS